MKKSVPVAELKMACTSSSSTAWTETVHIPGFYLESDEQLETLKLYCKTVFVDPIRRSWRADRLKRSRRRRAGGERRGKPARSVAHRQGALRRAGAVEREVKQRRSPIKAPPTRD